MNVKPVAGYGIRPRHKRGFPEWVVGIGPRRVGSVCRGGSALRTAKGIRVGLRILGLGFIRFSGITSGGSEDKEMWGCVDFD